MLIPPLLTTLLAGGCGDTLLPGSPVTPAPVQASGSSLCFPDYQKCVSPIFDATLQGESGVVTCSAAGCHSQATGSGGAFKIYPNAQADSAEMQSNFFSAQSFADLDDPADSKLLLKPSVMGRSQGVGHAGGNIFPSPSDACYIAIKTWISNRVDDPNSPVCGMCVAPVLSSCGY
jgi:predicted CxxxxCH...CXXCH cytochrome family protein